MGLGFICFLDSAVQWVLSKEESGGLTNPCLGTLDVAVPEIRNFARRLEVHLESSTRGQMSFNDR
jgi:hypothetical protein